MKMTLFDILTETISKEFIIPKKDGILKIEEKNIGAIGKEVILKTFGKVFSFSLDQKENDKFRVYQFFEKSTPNINSKNDAIIICEKEGRHYVLLIELKSKNNSEYLKQIKKGKIFADFLKETINLHYDINFQPEYRGVLFSVGNRKNARKQTTCKSSCKYENVNGIKLAKLENNSTYYLEYFLV